MLLIASLTAALPLQQGHHFGWTQLVWTPTAEMVASLPRRPTSATRFAELTCSSCWHSMAAASSWVCALAAAASSWRGPEDATEPVAGRFEGEGADMGWLGFRRKQRIEDRPAWYHAIEIGTRNSRLIDHDMMYMYTYRQGALGCGL